MLFAVLGPISFQALGSPESFESKRAWQYAEHKVVEAVPVLQFTAPALEEISLEVMLHVNYAQPLSDLQALMAAASAHQALPLVFGSGVHRGWFVITALAETARQLADDGSLIAVSVKMELKEYARIAATDATAPPQPAAPPPGLIVGALAPGQVVAGTILIDGTVTYPPAQAGMTAVMNAAAAAGASLPNPNPATVPPTTIWRWDSSVRSLLQ
jgi:phage protein U